MRTETEIVAHREEILKYYQENYFKLVPDPYNVAQVSFILSAERAIMVLNWVLGGVEAITDEQQEGKVLSI